MGIDNKTYAAAKTYANKVALGFKSVTQTATGFKITFKDGTTATYNVQNMHEHANKNILDLLSVDSNGNLLYDGKSISPDFIDTAGDGSKFLANDGTYKAVTTGGVAYDDTQVKADIQTNADDITDINNAIGADIMGTTATTITGAVKEINGNQLDTVSFSADYKNIVLNRKNGLNPYTIPISAIINHAKLIELGDIDTTDIGNGKTLIYDAATQKHKYADSTGTDELVKMEATTDAHYLTDLIDKQTIVNDNGVLKVKKLDGQDVTIAEINYLKGLTMNVMDLVNTFANGGVKIINTPLNAANELDTMDRSAFIDGISYIVYVLADENHAGAKTTYLVDKTNTTFFGNVDSQRNFTTDPIDLANEVTGKLGTSNIDVDSLWALLTVDDTYKTLTATDNVFGTHGAKALYDELTTTIGGKANATDLTNHTDDTNIHVTTTERTKWNKVSDKVDTTDFNTHKNNTDIHITTAERTKWNGKEDNSNKTTTINSTSTNTQYPSAKAVYNNAIKDKNIKTYTSLNQLGLTMGSETLQDIAKSMVDGSMAIIVIRYNDDTPIYPEKYGNLIAYRGDGNRTDFMFYPTGDFAKAAYLYICSYHKDKDLLRDWQKVCSTTVADVPKTTITLVDSTNYAISSDSIFSYYEIINGTCYVDMIIKCISPINGNSTAPGHLSLPKPRNSFHVSLAGSVGTTDNITLFLGTNAQFFKYGTANGVYIAHFSYPVAES